MYCPACGHENPEGAKFCMSCRYEFGQPLPTNATEQRSKAQGRPEAERKSEFIWKCAKCGTLVEADFTVCWACTAPRGDAKVFLGVLDERSNSEAKESSAANDEKRALIKIGCGSAGFALGGFIGFLLRPAVPFIGQLPFETVISRGTNLKGLDALLLGAAQTSFNLMLAGSVIGVILGLIAGAVLSRKG